jgi:hypothetical protein
MPENKIQDLYASQNPEEVADSIGTVVPNNYLAHTIRGIELDLLQNRHLAYHISVTYGVRSQEGNIYFHDTGCNIQLPNFCIHDDNPKLTRLIIAHELGHLFYNFDKLPVIPNECDASRSVEEQGWSWKFAYGLINKRSQDHENIVDHGKYIYQPRELKAAISNRLSEIVNNPLSDEQTRRSAAKVHSFLKDWFNAI